MGMSASLGSTGPCPSGGNCTGATNCTQVQTGFRKSHGHQAGTKLNARMKHNNALTPSDFGGFKTTDLMKNDKLLVHFVVSTDNGLEVDVWAKLHLLQVRKETAGAPAEIRGHFPIGQQIEAPTATGMGHFNYLNVKSDHIEVVDTNVAHVSIGDVVYEVVTFDALMYF